MKFIFLSALMAVLFACNAYASSAQQMQQEIFDQESGRSKHSDLYQDPAYIQKLLKPGDSSEAQESLQTNIDLDRNSYNHIFQSTGMWGVHIVYIGNDGSRQVLTSYRMDKAIKPASTMKLFTAYLAFLNQSYPVYPSKNFDITNTTDVIRLYTKNNPSMVYMLHQSNNEMADEALISAIPPVLKTQKLYSVEELLKLGASNMKKFYSFLTHGELFKPVNGSGLNNTILDSGEKLNQVTAAMETSLLEVILKSKNYHTFKTLLPQPGDPLGTLKLRLIETHKIAKIYAKTGTLDRTISLAGFAETTKGVIIFSIIGDELKLAPKSQKVSDVEKAIFDTQSYAKDVIDNLVTLHAQFQIDRGL